jgi:peptidoglycan hydrolase-like protein with peptidoglycan-binding domain
MTADDFWAAAATSGHHEPTHPVPPFPGRKLHQPPPMSGADVRTWQAQMARRGWPIKVDGSYGAASAGICRKFQAEKGLVVDGVVGVATLACHLGRARHLNAGGGGGAWSISRWWARTGQQRIPSAAAANALLLS